MDLTYRLATDDLYENMPDARKEGFEENSAQALQLTAVFDENYAGVKILLDKRSREIFDEVINGVGTGAKFIRALSMSHLGIIKEGDDVRMWNTLNEILRDEFPKLKKDLEAHIDSITQA